MNTTILFIVTIYRFGKAKVVEAEVRQCEVRRESEPERWSREVGRPTRESRKPAQLQMLPGCEGDTVKRKNKPSSASRGGSTKTKDLRKPTIICKTAASTGRCGPSGDKTPTQHICTNANSVACFLRQRLHQLQPHASQKTCCTRRRNSLGIEFTRRAGSDGSGVE